MSEVLEARSGLDEIGHTFGIAMPERSFGIEICNRAPAWSHI